MRAIETDCDFPIRQFLVRGAATPQSAFRADGIPRFLEPHPYHLAFRVSRLVGTPLTKDAARVDVTYSMSVDDSASGVVPADDPSILNGVKRGPPNPRPACAPRPRSVLADDELRRLAAMRNAGAMTGHEVRRLRDKFRDANDLQPLPADDSAASGTRGYKSYTLTPRVPWLRVAILSGLASAAILYTMRLNGWL